MKKKFISSILAVSMIMCSAAPQMAAAAELTPDSVTEVPVEAQTEEGIDGISKYEDIFFDDQADDKILVIDSETEVEEEELLESESGIGIKEQLTLDGDGFVEDGFVEEIEENSLEIPESLLSDSDSEIKEYEDFQYVVLEDGTAEIQKYTGKETENLDIPDEIDGYMVTSIGQYAFEACECTGDLKLPMGLTNIGCGAFRWSQFSGDLVLPQNLVNIGDYAFSGCNFTGNLSFPDKMNYLGRGAFFNTGFTGELILPEGLTTIEESTFDGCDFTGDLIIPDGIISIGNIAFCKIDNDNAFGGKLELPDSLQNIGYMAFSCCGFTGDLVCRKNVKNIGWGAFEGNNFINIVLSDSIDTIGDGAFYKTHNKNAEGEFILPILPADMSEDIFGYNEYNTGLIYIDLTTKIEVGHSSQGMVTVDGLKLSSPIVAGWSSSDESVATVTSEGLVTALSAGYATICATLYNGMKYENPVYVPKRDYTLYTSPGIEQLQDLWVGDRIIIGRGGGQEADWLKHTDKLSDLEVVSGENLISINEYVGYSGGYYKYWKIECEEVGEAEIRVHYENDIMQPIDINLNITQRVEDVDITPTAQSVKLGGWWEPFYLNNMFYGDESLLYANKEDTNHFFIHSKLGGAWGGQTQPYKRNSLSRHIYTTENGIDYSCPIFDSYPVNPGTVTLNYFRSREEAATGIAPLNSATITIEEPAISTNLKSAYSVGDSLDLTVSLQNTCFPDIELEKPEEREYLYDSQNRWSIYYTPKLEVLSGADCIDFVGNEAITTLTLKQQLCFKKAGTVVLKITYEPSGIDASVNQVYQPEKTITVQVKPDKVTATFDSAGGSAVPSQTVAYGSCIKEPTTPTRSGYKFLGWYQGNTKYDFSKRLEEDTRLTAKWSKEDTKVSSITLNQKILRLKQGQTVQLLATVKPADAVNKSIKWTSSNTKVATVSNGKVKAKSLGTAVIKATAADGSGKSASCKVTVGYTVTYKLNKGKNNSANPTVYYKEKISLKNPTRKGYLFKGWYTDKNFKKKITQITAKDKKNLTLYAKWEKISVGKTTVTSFTNKSPQKAVLKYKSVRNAKGYQIIYSTDKKFKKNCTTLTTKSRNVTLKGLKKKKTYYVKVRAYKVDSAGQKVYGTYSGVKKVKITK